MLLTNVAYLTVAHAILSESSLLCLPVFSCVQFAGWQPLYDSTSVVNLVRDGRRVYKALTGNKSSLCCFAVTTVVSGSPSPGVFFFAPSCIGARYNIKWRRGKTASSSRSMHACTHRPEASSSSRMRARVASPTPAVSVVRDAAPAS